MITADDLLSLSDAYAAARGVKESRVSNQVFNDGKALGRIRAGGDVGVRRLAIAWRWFDANWPDGADWPADIERPVVEGESAEHAPTMAEASAQSTHV